jgi:hypothetical protein
MTTPRSIGGEMPPTPTEIQESEVGEVTLTIPKAEFDKLHEAVIQLAGMVDGLKSQFDMQKMSSAEGGEEIPPLGEEMSPKEADMAELAMFANELSSRS